MLLHENINQKAEEAANFFEAIVSPIPHFTDPFGKWILHHYIDRRGNPYWIQTVGDVSSYSSPYLRIDDMCVTGFTLFHIAPSSHPDAACDCRQQSELSKILIQQEGCGMIIHTPFEARGHGTVAKALQLQKQGKAIENNEPLPDVISCFKMEGYNPTDARDYTIIKAIVAHMKLLDKEFVLLSNNRQKKTKLVNLGIQIAKTKQLYSPKLRAYYEGKNFLSKFYEDNNGVSI